MPLLSRAFVATAIIVAVLGWVASQGPAFATRVVVENGPVEVVQGLLLATVMVLVARRAARLVALGRSAASEVVLFFGFSILLAGELEAWQVVFGRTLTTRHVLRMSPIKFGFAMVTLALIVTLMVAVVVYTLRHFRELLAWALAALRSDWGWVLLTGLLIFACTELFERKLNSIQRAIFPKTFLEEGLELLANSFFVLALRERDRVDPVGRTPRDPA
ncbi:MAG TPA: hypothetical protein VJU81_10325 [Methylomirabilota bacterium]|nr:hypothetical protein [Methylomirabilota bacterium]